MALDTARQSSDTLGALSLDTDRGLQRRTHELLHRLSVRSEFWTIEYDRAVGVHDVPTSSGDGVSSDSKQHEAVSPFELGRGIGKVMADIAKPCRTKNRIGDGVGNDVGIAVACQPWAVLERDPAQHQRPARIIRPGVHIEPLSDPHLGKPSAITHPRTLPHPPFPSRKLPRLHNSGTGADERV